MKSTTKKIVRSAVIAAIYATLTLILRPISFSAVQVRVSEALTLLPLFMPEAVVGLTVGCLIANFFGNGILDIVFGTLATFSASLITYLVGRAIKSTPLKLTLGSIPPVLLNAIIVPFTFLALTELKEAYLLNLALVGLGQLVAVCALGIPLYFVINKILQKSGLLPQGMETKVKKIVILINAYFSAPGYMLQCQRIKDELIALGAQAEIMRNDRFIAEMNGKSTSISLDCDACVYLDKDKYVSKMLEDCGVRLFNPHSTVRACDDKMITHITLSNCGVEMPYTLPGLLCYDKNATVKQETVDAIENKIGYPVIVKESYGSLGKGVHIANDRNQLIDVMERVKTIPHLYQKAITSSLGKDMRVIVIGGKAVGAMIRSNDDNFRSNIGAGGNGTKVDLPDEFRVAAEKAASALNADYCGVDLLFGDQGQPVLCEVNSNAFFDGFEKTTGINVARLYAQHILNSIK